VSLRAEITRRFLRLLKNQARLTTLLNQAEWQADCNKLETQELKRLMVAAGLLESAALPDGRRPRPPAIPPNRVTPPPRARTIEVTRTPKGSIMTSLDGGNRLKLPPSLAQFLQFLAGDNHRSDDGLIGWWSLREIALAMTQKLGRPVGERCIRQWVYRLRNTLAAGGYDWRLVRTDPRLGVRLALERQAPPPSSN
jgi:hypothetical protein